MAKKKLESKKELDFLKNLVENSPDGIHILDQTGDVIYCSQRFAVLLGYSYKEALNLNVRDWDRQFPVDQLVPVIKDLIEKPRMFETKHEKKSGEIIDVEINAKGIELDGQFYLYATSRDISNSKEEVLLNRKNNAKLNSIFKTIPDAFFVIDHRGIIETVNKKATEMFGYNENELIGKNISMIVPPEHSKGHDNYIKRYLDSGVARIIGKSRELEAIDNKGKRIPISINLGEVKTDDGILFIGIIRDITEIKENQLNLEQSRNEALAAEKAKSLFLTNMSHEIRTPMNGILGMVSLLHDTDLDKNQKEMVSIVNSCGDSLLTIINDILDVSKIESGKLLIENSHFDLLKAIDEVIYLISNMVSERGITIQTKISPEVPIYLFSDAVRLRQILTNLLNNAVKFSPNGGEVTLSISTLSSIKDKVRLKFEVKDNGIGMSKEEQTRLFKEFSQAEEGITRRFGGTGLGLSICLKLTEMMGGNIRVESKKGKGSNFIFELEFKTGKKPSSEKVELDYEFFSNTYPHKILVVEDNKINQKLASKMFEKLGYDYDLAENGKIAVELASKNSYSLIFMDMQMPIMDGITATKEILKEREVTIIAMTANVLQEDKDRCFEVGMKDFITKPIKLSLLAKTIKKHS